MRMAVSGKGRNINMGNSIVSMEGGERRHRSQSMKNEPQQQTIEENREALKRIKEKADHLNKEVKKIMDREGENESGRR
jgi:hypothetical protein